MGVTVAANRKNHHLKNDQAQFVPVTGMSSQLIEGVSFAEKSKIPTQRKCGHDRHRFPWYHQRFWPGEYLQTYDVFCQPGTRYRVTSLLADADHVPPSRLRRLMKIHRTNRTNFDPLTGTDIGPGSDQPHIYGVWSDHLRSTGTTRFGPVCPAWYGQVIEGNSMPVWQGFRSRCFRSRPASR